MLNGTAGRSFPAHLLLLGVLLAACAPEEVTPVPRHPVSEEAVAEAVQGTSSTSARDTVPGTGASLPATGGADDLAEPVIRAGSPPSPPRTLLVDQRLDVTGDGVEERIQLYVDAPRGADGELQWDDGQRWLLLVRAEEGAYVLFDDYVQIGDLQFWVATIDGYQVPRIFLLRSTTAGMELRAYRHLAPDRFTYSTEFSFTGNMLYTSPPPT